MEKYLKIQRVATFIIFLITLGGVIECFVSGRNGTILWAAAANILSAALWFVLGDLMTAHKTVEAIYGAIEERVRRIDELKKERAEIDAKYQALDNEQMKLVKENAQLHERVDDLRKQRSDYAEKYQTASQDLDNANQKVEQLTQALEAKKPAQKTAKKKVNATKDDNGRVNTEVNFW